jgi:type IV pilus assembly protein PilB
VGKFDIDDILKDLGVTPGQVPGRPKRPAPLPEERRANRSSDQAEQSFSVIPAVPSGQRSFNTNVTVNDDPAVPVKPREITKTRVGDVLTEFYTPEEAEKLAAAATDLGESLVAVNAVTRQQLTAAQQVIKASPGRRLADVLLEQGAMEEQLFRGLAAEAGLAFERVDLNKGADGGFDVKLLNRLTPEFCKENALLPLRAVKTPGMGPAGLKVTIAGTQPENVFLIDEVKRRLGVTRVTLVVSVPSDIKTAIELTTQADQQQNVDINEILADVDEGDVEVEKKDKEHNETVDLETQAGESPVIRYVNYIIQNAVKEGASDIHIEPAEKKLKVRFRIDGALFEMMNPPAMMSAAITSRLKIMANLDISERRLPQDGRIRCTVGGRKLDLRMSTLPNGHGEKTVLRILDTKSINVNLEDLGFAEDQLIMWRKAIDEPHGIVLVTGPTGSGKTTTLYSSLRQLDKQSMNICTVEDPVEYHLDGITQTQTHEKIGMTFAKALKALLRQDPDVVMLGEIRDLETAQTAIQAALTGHLVLSTLHTNDAPGSITRLVNIGLEPFLVGAAVRAVLAQRLVRRLCVHCKANERPNDELSEYLGMNGMDADGVFVAKGCERCRNTGYSGRVGIYELLVVDDQLRDIIARNPNVAEFRRLCIERGMVTLRNDGLHKVAKGLTSVEEVLSVTEGNT